MPKRKLNLCFVAHRAAPYPGGTEVFVQAMAEEAQRRGHRATILAGKHQGDLNGVRVTGDNRVLDDEPFDLVVVHGATDGAPRATLDRADRLASPVLYLLVAHNAAHVRPRHLRASPLLGWSTPLDQVAIARAGAAARSVRVRHGIVAETGLGQPGFRARHGIAPDRVMFVSCGGYGSNKRMKPLAKLFTRAGVDALLVTTGYAARKGEMPAESAQVMPLLVEDRAEVLSAIAEADCYLMHSRDEGFGLVLLEAMLNRTPWIANETGGATVLGACGQTYRRDADLIALLRGFSRDEARVARAEAIVRADFTIANTLDDIEAAAAQAATAPRALPWRRPFWSLNIARKLP